jgi:hypothetical protein
MKVNLDAKSSVLLKEAVVDESVLTRIKQRSGCGV